ncbi:PKD domain-containing protein [Candidatus Peregrinibacteria bacterium]|nr:MAG: PKD domain-containing protein [Candidatus Peregrinibacteria bacterium]
MNTLFYFTSQDSRSDDGLIDALEWTIQDDEGQAVFESEEAAFDYRFSRPGDYKIILTVTDIRGERDTVVETVSVRSRPPVSAFEYEKRMPNHPNQVFFDAIHSYDPDEGDRISYSWDFNNDGDFELVGVSDTAVEHTYDRPGTYRVRLQVEDSFGQRALSEQIIEIDSVLSADLVMDRAAVKVGEPITFKSRSTNAQGYLWEFGDGTTESTSKNEVTHTYEKSGSYLVVMNFFDRDDNGLKDTAHLLVSSGDEPVAVAHFSIEGADPNTIEDLCGEGKSGLVVTRADRIRLDAGASLNTDGSGRLLSYQWNLPGDLKNSNKQTQYKFESVSASGECAEIGLTVRDDLSGRVSQEDILYFKVVNQVPEVTDFIFQTSETDLSGLVTPLKVHLKLIGPRDVDGTIKKYRWWYTREGFEDERFALHSTAQPETELIITSYGNPGQTNRYYFWAELIDNDGGVYETRDRFDEVNFFEVTNGPNLSPVVNFTMDKTVLTVGDSVTFDSSAYDPQGDVLPPDAYRWDFDGDGNFDDSTSGAQVSRQYNTPGEYSVRLKVVYRGLSSTAQKTISVEPSNSLPQAAFTYAVRDDQVVFDASNSRFDPEVADPALRFEWDFDIDSDADGNGVNDDDVQSTELRPTFSYPAIETYRVKLTVKDNTGREGVVARDVDLNLTEAERLRNSYQTLRISAPTHALTYMDVDVIPARLKVGRTADITVRILNADGSPYEGEVFFDVLEGSGEFSPNPVLADQSIAQALFRATGSGQVVLRVRATQTLFGELSEEIILTVEP